MDRIVQSSLAGNFWVLKDTSDNVMRDLYEGYGSEPKSVVRSGGPARLSFFHGRLRFGNMQDTDQN